MTIETKSIQTNRIRALNDDLRQNLGKGRAVMTCGVAALGAEAVAPQRTPLWAISDISQCRKTARLFAVVGMEKN